MTDALVCVLCRFPLELDDAVALSTSGRTTVCVRCSNRETGHEKRIPEWLRADVVQSMIRGGA